MSTITVDTRKQILSALAALGGRLVQEDALTFEGNRIILPAMYRDDIPGFVRYLEGLQEQQEQKHTFSRTYKYRVNDVAAAFVNTLKKVFGTTGIGAATQTMFGEIPPAFRTIDVGVGQTMQVPEGWTAFPPLSGKMAVGADDDYEVGIIGKVIVQCPRKYRAQVEGLFYAIEEELRTNSIYRGKAVDGADNPSFIDTSKVDPHNVVYSEEVLGHLQANVWSLIEHTDLMKENDIPLKRAILLEGPYGSGKTLAAYLTAKIAEENGWTFVYCRPQDNLQQTMQTAKLYEPAVVFFEDVDVLGQEGDPGKVSKLLDVFDGMTAKGASLMAILTTNHVDRIHKGLLRPGRMDAVIHIAELDRYGMEKLIKANLPNELLVDIDWDLVYKAYGDFLPAFAKEAAHRSIRYAIGRLGAMPEFLTTGDLVDAAEGLKPQLHLMEQAEEGKAPDSFNKLVTGIVAGAVDNSKLFDSYGDPMGHVKVLEQA